MRLSSALRAALSRSKSGKRISSRRVGRSALAGEALHPDAVGHEQMVERPGHRFEERPYILVSLFLRQFARDGIDEVVGPVVVRGEHAEMLLHEVWTCIGCREAPAA